MLEIKGKSIFQGVAISKLYYYKKNITTQESASITLEELEDEIGKFRGSVEKSQIELNNLMENLKGKVRDKELEILFSQLIMLKDPMFIGDIEKNIRQELHRSQKAVEIVRDKFVKLFQDMNNPLFQQRKDDIIDVSNRILENLNSNIKESIKREENFVLVAKEILPSELLKFVDISAKIEGLVLEYGGETSHVAILAKNIGIPTLMGAKNIEELSKEDGRVVIIDSRIGEERLIVGPTIEMIYGFREILILEKKKRDEIERDSNKPVITKDGVKISLKININSSQDVENDKCSLSIIDGVGLLRTELLYMEAEHFPTEEEQYRLYKEISEKIGQEKELIIRTLDIGADKTLPYYELKEEENPFLGVRGIRHSLRNRDIFKTQLRAILRASYNSNIKIMYPMITLKSEILEAREILEECKRELKEREESFNPSIPVGIMIEVPSAAIMADQLASYVDFLSIGSNDLTQYILATDRVSEELFDLYDSYEPSVLRGISFVTEAGIKRGKSVSICGEMAGEELAVIALLSLGMKEFSMVKGSVNKIANLIRKINLKELSNIKYEILNSEDSKKIKKILQEYLKKTEINGII